MSWDPTRLLANALYRAQVRLTMHDPQVRACELAESIKHSANHWGPDVYVRMTKPTRHGVMAVRVPPATRPKP